jgi:predicted DNA-binding transcriptional regulator AlpA
VHLMHSRSFSAPAYSMYKGVVNTEHSFISRKELAGFLGVSLSTVDRGIRDNRWPYNKFIRVGIRKIYYSVTLKDEILNSFNKDVNDRTDEAR